MRTESNTFFAFQMLLETHPELKNETWAKELEKGLERIIPMAEKNKCENWGKRENGSFGPCGKCDWCKEFVV